MSIGTPIEVVTGSGGFGLNRSVTIDTTGCKTVLLYHSLDLDLTTLSPVWSDDQGSANNAGKPVWGGTGLLGTQNNNAGNFRNVFMWPIVQQSASHTFTITWNTTNRSSNLLAVAIPSSNALAVDVLADWAGDVSGSTPWNCAPLTGISKNPSIVFGMYASAFGGTDDVTGGSITMTPVAGYTILGANADVAGNGSNGQIVAMYQQYASTANTQPGLATTANTGNNVGMSFNLYEAAGGAAVNAFRGSFIRVGP